MLCSEFQRDILDYFYEEASPHLLAKAVDHRMGCPDCLRAWNEMSQVTDIFHSLKNRSPSQDLLQLILKQVKETNRGILFKDRILSWFYPAGRPWVWVAPVAVVLIILSISVIKVVPNIEEKSDSGILAEPIAHEIFNFLDSDRGPSAVSEGFRPVATEGASLSALKDEFMNRHRLLLEEDADRLLMRGRRYKTMGRMDLALRDFETIYRFYPDYTYMGDVLMYRAQCYAFQGYMNEALSSLKTYLKREPSKKGIIQPMIDQLVAGENAPAKP